MINGFDSYKLTINNLNDVNADTVNSVAEYTGSLYINNQLIDFSAYITSSYLSTVLSSYVTNSSLSSTLGSYVTNSSLSSTLGSYVTNSSLSSTLSSYATTNALSSYRLISDSFNKSDVTNEVVIRTGYPGTNPDGSIKTCKQYTDEVAGGLSAATAVNSAAIAGVVASLAVTNATIAGIGANVSTLNADVATINGDLTTINGQITTLQTKTQNITATAGVTNISGSVNTTTVSCTNLEVTAGGHTLNIGTNLYGGPLSDNINIGSGIAFNNVNILGVLYINGTPFVPFNVSNAITQWS